MIIQIKVIDSSKGRYFYSHILPFLSNKIGELKYEIVPLNQIKENYDKSPPILIFGDKKYGNYFKHNFIEIDDFLTETKSYSFTIDDIEKLLKVLKCYQR